MKVGSLVECLGGFQLLDPSLNCPEKGVIYTVREICRNMDNEVGIKLEEIVNKPKKYLEGTIEPAWKIEFFREVQPPMSLGFIEQLQFEMV